MSELTIIDSDEMLEEGNDIQLVGMKLGDEEYAIDVLKIQEIIRTVEITIVPRSESFVLGVMNMRGKVVPVIDLRVRFNLEKSDFDKATRIIVVRFEKEHIGFVVDEVTQVFRISKAMVEPTPPLVGAIGQEYILGICKYEERLIIILDIERIISNSNALGDSDLRKKFMNKPSAKKLPKLPEESAAPAAASAPAEIEAAPSNYSMADEADALSKPLITAAPSDDDLEAILNDAVNQGSAVTQAADEHEVQQSELDALIAKELAAREAETEELNRKKREAAGGGGAAPAASAPASTEDMDIDALIKLELEKREAETEELNKKRREENGDDKKKNELTEAVEAEAQNDTINASESGLSSLEELKAIAGKIINGESSELDIDIKGEFGELLRLLVDIKGRVDEIPPTVLNTQSELPEMSSTLTDVNSATERAAFNLLESAQKMSEFYKTLMDQVNTLEESVKNKNKESFESQQNTIQKEIEEAGDLGLHILEALEFQDITEQKLRKVLKYIEDVGARLGVIVGYMKAKDEEGGKKYDNVLSDLGFS